MLSMSSNCCRVDAVKATANQLKMQLAQVKADEANKPIEQTATQQLQSLDSQIKSGDANKAELALSAAKLAIQHVQYARPAATHKPSSHPPMYGTLSVYA